MIVYNITTKVHSNIDAAWLQWQKEEHIPEMMATGLFTDYKLFRLLDQDDSEGNTYVIQYSAANADQYSQYTTVYAALLRQKAFRKWGDQFISFRSVLEVIH
jgi:hypothetical protein